MHWKYFIALEKDLETISRYIELDPSNFNTFSIELTKLLLSSASEIDVVLKLICTSIKPGPQYSNIDDYAEIISENLPEFLNESVLFVRTSIILEPWKNWSKGNSPYWWKSYNKVKHERSSHYKMSNLENALNSVAALMISVFYLQKLEMGNPPNKDVTRLLIPESHFIRLNENYYYSNIIV